MDLEKKIVINNLRSMFLRSFLIIVLTLLTGFTPLAPKVMGKLGTIHIKRTYLNDYLFYAAENNPGLKTAFNRWKAELEKVVQVRSLPDPSFNFAYFIREVETKVGPQQMKVGLMQKFPWFGKLKLHGEKTLKRAQALKENFESQKLELFYEIKKLYYDYYFIYRSIIIIGKNISLLDAVNGQIRLMYQTGIASYRNLIRIQVELAKLKERKKSLESKLPSVRIALNTLMNRPVNEDIHVESKIENSISELNGHNLVPILRKSSPKLKILDNYIFSEKAGVKIAEKNFLPDISIGAEMIVTGDSQVPGVIDSGKDPFLVKASLNLPIRFKKLNASVREAKLRLDAAKYERIEKENRLISSLESALSRFNDSGRIVNLYRASLIPLAKQALEVTRSAFSTGDTDFLDFIDTQRTVLDFELIYEKANSSYHQDKALIEKIIGKNLNNLLKEENFATE